MSSELSIKEWVGEIYKDYKKQYFKEPTFEDIIIDCIKLRGIEIADFLFSTLKDAWLENNYPITDFKLLREKIFCYDRARCYFEIEQIVDEWNEIVFNSNYDEQNQEVLSRDNYYNEEDQVKILIDNYYYLNILVEVLVYKVELDYLKVDILFPFEYGNSYYDTTDYNCIIPISEFTIDNKKINFTEEDISILTNQKFNAKIKSVNKFDIILTRKTETII
jgi:hypothetical protein